MLFPLSYTGIAGARRVELLTPESESGALTVMRSAYNIVTEIPRARIEDPGYAQNGWFVAARFLRHASRIRDSRLRLAYHDIRSRGESNAHLLGASAEDPFGIFSYGMQPAALAF